MVPLLLNLTELTASACAFIVAISMDACVFQRRIVLSRDALARIVPLLLNEIEFIIPVCPCNVEISLVSSSFPSSFF